MGARDLQGYDLAGYGSGPNLSALPKPTAQMRLDPDWQTWQTLDVANLAAGKSYNDPVTHVRIWKVTSASVPAANSFVSHDYSEGGHQISRGWGSGGNHHTLAVRTDSGVSYLVDFEKGVGFSNWRQFPSDTKPRADLFFSFASDPSTPQIAFVHTGQEVHRLDTAKNQRANTAPFPKTFKTDSGQWFHQDMNDRWFVMLNGIGDAATGVIVWDRVNNQTYEKTFSNLDEPHLERSGHFVAVKGPQQFWDLDHPNQDPVSFSYEFSHPASLLGYFVATNSSQSAPFPMMRILPGPPASQVAGFTEGIASHNHLSGNWLQPNDEPAKQWVLASSYWKHGDNTYSYFLHDGGIGLFRADGSDWRLLCHTYEDYQDQGSEYFETPRATIAMDGTMVMFDTDMNNSGRSDVFLVEMPQ